MFIPYAAQCIEQDDIEAAVLALGSKNLTQGPLVAEFETALAKYCGAKYAVAVANGTAALHLAALATGIGQGDEVITSPITFVASANCALYCGAKPVFADIEPGTANIDPGQIKQKITDKTRAIVPVHFAGQPVELAAIHDIARQHKLRVIEDASHALGSSFGPDKIGACRYSDMTTFSFHAIKSITTGEGGAVLTNDEALWRKLRQLRTHGITKEVKSPGPWYYEMQSLGFNYRLTDIQSALGLCQLKKLDRFTARRKNVAGRYTQALQVLDWLKLLDELPGRTSARHLFVVLIDYKKLGKSRGEVMQLLKEQGIGTQVHYIPVHLQPYYREVLGTRAGDLPQAEKYYEQTLSLPLFAGITDDQVEKVIQKVSGLQK